MRKIDPNAWTTIFASIITILLIGGVVLVKKTIDYFLN